MKNSKRQNKKQVQATTDNAPKPNFAKPPKKRKTPKRVGYVREQMCEPDLIRAAIFKAAKGKHDKRAVRRVLRDVDFYVNFIQKRIMSDNLRLTENRQMVRYDRSCNKMRNITIPKFVPDQIIHWVIIMVIQPVLERGMYKYSCGSVPRRGGLAAKKYVEETMHDAAMRYVMKLDIHHFFPSIDTGILMKKLEARIKDKAALSLIKQVLDNGGDGLPIGYYTSQWLSNFYLQDFDHFVKEELRIPYYVRYVDDTVFFHRNKRQMRRALEAIRAYLAKDGLTLKDNWQIWKIDSRPIDFVGYKFTRINMRKTKEQKLAAAEAARPRLAKDGKPAFVRVIPEFIVRTELRPKIYYRLCRRVRHVENHGAATLMQARGLLSLYGWLKHINGQQLYKEYIYDITPKNKLQRFVGTCDRLHIPPTDSRKRLSCVRQTRNVRQTLRRVA